MFWERFGIERLHVGVSGQSCVRCSMQRLLNRYALQFEDLVICWPDEFNALNECHCKSLRANFPVLMNGIPNPGCDHIKLSRNRKLQLSDRDSNVLSQYYNELQSYDALKVSSIALAAFFTQTRSLLFHFMKDESVSQSPVHNATTIY